MLNLVFIFNKYLLYLSINLKKIKMKLVKGFLAIALISIIAVSCKETKKEEITNDAVEMTEVETEKKAEATHETSRTIKKTENVEKSIKTTTEGLEEIPVYEGVIYETTAETPVIYPGCEGSAEEIRACSLKKFKKSLSNNFNSDLANTLDLEPGDYKIRAIIKIDETGNASVLKVDAPHADLEKEVVRLIDKLPQMTPATVVGKPVSVSFLLPINFKIID